MKVLQINTIVNSGSTGRMAEGIGKLLIARGHRSYIAFGYGNRSSASYSIRIGNKWDQKLHGLRTRLLDRHGFGSRKATIRLIREIDRIDPDIIHLHNIHGYYLNIKELFNFLKASGKPVVWTLHDCWPFTGHCAHFERVNCYKWKRLCFSCPLTTRYPASWGWDNSKKNYRDKRELFNGVRSLRIVTPSQWLAGHLKESFLKDYPTQVISNGVDLELFRTREDGDSIKKRFKAIGKKFVLGVANIWPQSKGLADFFGLSNKLSPGEVILLVGLSKKQLQELPPNMVGILRTESMKDLVSLYSAADVFVNPTYADSFPSTHLEALACGTPVVTYKTGGGSEAIDGFTGRVVGRGDIEGLDSAVKEILRNGKAHYAQPCRQRAEKFFNAQDRYGDYLTLYKDMLGL